jgi:hypothetical protein
MKSDTESPRMPDRFALTNVQRTTNVGTRRGVTGCLREDAHEASSTDGSKSSNRVTCRERVTEKISRS